MSLSLLTPPPPSLATPPPRRPSAGAAASSSSAAASAARPPISRLRVSCRAACRAPPPPSIAELDPRRRGEGPSLYEVLRVRENASAREIKAAYRALAKSHHPDAAGRDGRDFIEIHDAYETLSDPAARAVYDLSLGEATSGAGSSRRRPGPRGGGGGFCPTGRWETDQCW